MGIYRYIFFTILSVYKRFSKDPQIWIFAFGFFTFIVSLYFVSIYAIYGYYVLHNYSQNYIHWLIIAGIIFVFNVVYLVLNHQKQEEYYSMYLKRRTKIGYLFVGVFIVLAFVVMLWTATKLREKNLEKKQQTTEKINKASANRGFI